MRSIGHGGQAALTALLLLGSSVTVAQADPERGRLLAPDCAACHGQDGNSPSAAYPIIAGQHEDYLYVSLVAYRDRTRDNAIMSAAVVGKSDQELRDLAAWYAGQRGLGLVATGLSQPVVAAAAAAGGSLLIVDGADLTPVVGFLPDLERCPSGSPDIDSDGDGLADAFDAAPDDPDEFVLDTNGDGRYEICNIQQLQAILTLGEGEAAQTSLTLEERMSRSYELVRDIDVAELENFRPIGNCGPTGNCMNDLDAFGFRGNFDGGGYTISNLRVVWPDDGGVGLFGVLARGSVVRNVELRDVTASGRAGTGTVVGSNFGSVYNCSSTGTVEGLYAIGGLVGANAGNVSWSRSGVAVKAEMAAGGLVGDQTGSVFSSYATGAVTADRGAGGLVGLSTGGRVVSSYATGQVSGARDIGGLVGINTDALIANSYATGRVSGSQLNTGGIAGFNSLSYIHNVYATGRIDGNEAVGGIVGNNNGTIGQSYSIARVSGARQAGALVGKNADGALSRSYWSRALSRQDNPSGTAEGSYHDTAEMSRIALQQLGGAVSGWAISNLQVKDPVMHFCDRDGSGSIESAEQTDDNLIWDFGDSRQLPAIRCTPGDITQQRR